MANYHIGLDFGTSQTKVCLLNKDSETREFIKFDNGSYFLPSIIARKSDNTFSYGKETESELYRYFKMAVAEDDDLIQVTNEDEQGNLPSDSTIEDFIKYSTDYKIKPDVLVILYLAYIYLFVKEKKNEKKSQNKGGLLGRLAGNTTTIQNAFSVSLGIPTEWGNPNHIKRKIKFQSLLLIAIKLANHFSDLDKFLTKNENDLIEKIENINKIHLSELDNKTDDEKEKIITKLLQENKLSVFPESAAGVNYLLKTKRLEDGCYATLDIGAGTSDIAIFEVENDNIKKYYCSESVEFASNDFYREYAENLYNKENITFEEIKEIEKIIRTNTNINDKYYDDSIKYLKYCIETSIKKMYCKKYYKLELKQGKDASSLNKPLHEKPIIIFGGGANLKSVCENTYRFLWQKGDMWGRAFRYFEAKAIIDFVSNIEIIDREEVEGYTNLLILALGLTYIDTENNNFIPFNIPISYDKDMLKDKDRYFYYDIQDAVYK